MADTYKFSGKKPDSGRKHHVADNVACCPECDSTFIVRVKRPWYLKLFTHKKRFTCRSCNAVFWRHGE